MNATNATETAGRTVDEAVAKALSALGAGREDVDVEIIQEAKPALLGLGGREARVRVTRRPDPGHTAQEVASEILGLMGYTASAEVQETAERVTVTIEGQELEGLVGRDGQTLDALEFLVALHSMRRLGRRVQVALDAEGYRARREKTLQEMASQAAGRAVRDRKPVFLEPMAPRDRRIVHLALQLDARVTTSSVGEDEDRRVVVHPSGEGEWMPEDSPEE